jgi:hypothetical protein
MELQARAVDRLLEALSPTLAAEIAKIIAETTQTLQAEYERKMEETILTVVASTEKAGEAKLEQALQRGSRTGATTGHRGVAGRV